MASKKKQAAKYGAGAAASVKAAKENEYIQRLVEDEDLRGNLRSAYESSRRAYERMSNGKGPTKAILDDKKTQKALKEAATSLREATDTLRGAKKKRSGGKGRLLLLALVGAGAAMALSEGLRKKVLDALFGAEEEFEYTSSTTPSSASSSASSSEPVGSS